MNIRDYIIIAINSAADITLFRDQEVASHNRRNQEVASHHRRKNFLDHGGRNYQEIHCTDIDSHITKAQGKCYL